jgi:pyruvate/2-oxoglutarate dehydrogenase complex dihydrolipoamide acyltransferase (E2) component
MTVGGISKKPTVRQDEIQVGELIQLTLSFDHDIVDGAPAARFTNHFIELLESGEILETPQT